MSRRPPESPLYNVGAEKLLLGSLLSSKDAFWRIESQIRADQFSLPIHRDIFRAIADISIAGGKVSITLLSARLPEEMQDQTGETVSPRDYLSVLADTAQDAGISSLDLADQIAELASRRQTIKIAEEMIRAARAGEKAAIDVAAEGESALLDVMQAVAPSRPVKLSTIVDQVLMASRRAHQSEYVPGYNTGLASLDEITGLIMPGDFFVILGAPGDGKSSLAAQIAMHIAGYGPVLNCHNEMTDEQIAVRQLAAASGQSVRAIREGAYDYWQLQQIQNAQEAMRVPQFYVWREDKMTMRKVRTHALAMKRTVGLMALVIDQLTHIRAERFTKDRFEKFSEVTSEAKSLAIELNVPVIMAAQRTRMSQRREEPTPHVDDADAPTVERDADAVLGVWREETWLRRNKPHAKAGGEADEKWDLRLQRSRGIAEVITLKLRNGQAYEQRKFKWDGPRTMFMELGT